MFPMLVTREMQITTTVQDCFTAAKNNQFWQERGEIGTLIH